MTTIFQSGGSFDNTGVSIGRCVLPDSVPKGKRLIIETVTGFYFGDGAELGSAFLGVGGLRFAFPWIQCTSPGLPSATAGFMASIISFAFMWTARRNCNSMRMAVPSSEARPLFRGPTRSRDIW